MATMHSPPGARGSNIVTTQCSQCSKIIINELLAFICNKVDTLPETGIVKICLSAYKSDEIENSRAIAYAQLAPTKKILRRKEGSEQKSLQDIIKIIKESEPECLPTFVAKNLNKLPPVSFDYIDITTFLKELTMLKNDVECIKSKPSVDSDSAASSVDINQLKEEMSEIKQLIKEIGEARTSSEQLKDLFLMPYRDDKDTRNTLNEVQNTANSIVATSEPRIDAAGTSLGAKAAGEQARRGGSRGHSQLSSARALPRAGSAALRAPAPPAVPALSTLQLTADTQMDSTYVPSYRDIASAARRESHANKDDDGFTLVTRNRKQMPYRYRNTRGILQSNTKLRAAESFTYIYLSRTQKSINENDIKEYIQEMNEECIEVEKLQQTRETNFNSFKIKITSSKVSNFLKNDFWPEGLVFRKYRNVVNKQ